MNYQNREIKSGFAYRMIVCGLFLLAVMCMDAAAFTLNVQTSDGTPVAGYRWLVEEDTTNYTIPGALVSDSISVDIHKSHAPVVTNGHTDSDSANIPLPGNTRYFVSVLPDNGYSISGTSIDLNQTAARVIVNPLPLPTSQISILAFNDNFPINNAPDQPDEAGLTGFKVTISDIFGQQMMDAFGNPLGTTYQQSQDGSFILDADGAPIMDMMGSGVIMTDANGEANIKYLAPGKYGVRVIPPAGTNWIQTATIEGTKVIDAWVKANEPKIFIEGFGAGTYHVAFGFVYPEQLPWAVNPPAGTGTITGRLVYNHFAKPPFLQGFWPGQPVSGGLVGLNDPANSQGLYAVACDGEGYFTINNVPPGAYQLVTWDENLDALFGFNTVTVPAGNSPTVALGNILCFNWFGQLEGSVFYDTDQDGFRDPDEVGMSDQNVNLRFRDGTIYQAQPTDLFGDYEFAEVFPFFKWLVVEVDFARFRDTGLTAVVDDGGEVLPDDGWVMPSRDKLHPQIQIDTDPMSPTFGQEIININTGNALSRTQVSDVPGSALLQAMQLSLNQINVIDWGKAIYDPGKNGGVSGVAFYDTTRAENDPRYCVGEPWCPGIPRVQINLYEDKNPIDGVIDDFNGDGPTLADVDNYPFGWRDNPALFEVGIDIDRNENGIFDAGDAIQIVTTDSWDDNMPTGSIQTVPVVHGQPVKAGFDNFATWNQIRPGVFDGGYAIGSYFPGGIDSGSAEIDGLPTGTYIVEAATPHGYELVKEEDKNVDFGDSFIPSPQNLPPLVVGDPHLVPAELSLFPGVECAFAGQTRPLCDRKQVIVSQGKNAASDFFFFTPVPKAARCVGFTLNDLSAEFDTTSPIFHEKAAPSWLPVSFQDWAGNELTRVYTDEWGGFNALLPSTYSINVPAPSGVAPNMITAVINDPGPIPDKNNPGQMIIDPFYDPDYSTTPWTLQYLPGSTTYLDTPLVPVAAFVGHPDTKVDIEPVDGTPVIVSVEGPAGGPVICSNGQQLVIKSAGDKEVPNPAYDPTNPVTTATVIRDFGFGSSGTIMIGTTTLTVDSWTNDTITATIDTNIVSTGTLKVTRNDTMLTSPVGVTVYIGNCANVIHVSVGQSIQAAIDSAEAGDIIAVGPGAYDENVILYKNVTLLGSGSGGTTIIGNPRPAEQLVAWHDKIVELLGTDPFAANEAPVIMVLGNAGYTFAQGSSGVISNFTLTGALSGGGIYVNSFADYLDISNNILKGNQGELGGGIVIGTPGLTDKNVNVYIHDNQVVKNSGITGGGGIVIYTGADNYLIKDNLIMGNLSRGSGGGICHAGLSDGGRIIGNKIINNEVYYGLLAPGGGDGGGIFVGSETATTGGAGSVTINGNLIQGNLAGAGYGGGIRALTINSTTDVIGPDQSTWFALNIFNNIIVNNVAAIAGGGIALQDAAKANIINNTIAENESTATAALAFPPGNLTVSDPQGAGIVSTAHSAALAALSGQTFSNPVLHDNIIWHNRSFSWNGNLNSGNGGLVVNPSSPFWDLQVSGIAGTLNPQHCVLSSTSGYAANNTSGDPMFLNSYSNTLLTAAVLDEGGNSITVRFTPLGIRGDYHIQNTSSAIVFGGGIYLNQFVALQNDYDDQVRTAGVVDSGADQVSVFVPQTIFTAMFNTDTDGFGYLDDTFRGTSQPAYASGSRVATGGFTGGALRVQLGGIDNITILGMSGGWQRTFTLASPGSVNVSFQYNLTQLPSYDSDESSEMMFAIDGVVIGSGANDYLARLTGNGNGGPSLTTGWQLFTTTISLPAGSHTITLGGYNNKKSSSNEQTNILVDNVTLLLVGGGIPGNTPPVINSVTATLPSILNTQTSQLLVSATDTDGPSPLSYNWIVPAGAGSVSNPAIANPVYTPPVVAGTQIYTLTVEVSDGQDTSIGTVDITVSDGALFSASFNTDTDSFGYQDNTFRGATASAYASGIRVATGGFTGGALQVQLGGIDNVTVLGIAGGWQRTFTLAIPTNVQVTFRYNMTQLPSYDADENSDMMFAIDGVAIGTGGTDYLARLTGNGNGGPSLTTGWQLFTTTVSLPAGSHTITIGGHNNKKTSNNEMTTILVDDVTLVSN